MIYKVSYRGDLIAEVRDFHKGFIDIVYGLSEVSIEEVEDKLEKYLFEKWPHEISEEEPVDTAIRLLEQLRLYLPG